MHYPTCWGKRERLSKTNISVHVSDEKFCLNIRDPASPPRPIPYNTVFVHAHVARFDGLLYAITLAGSESASLSVCFKKGTSYSLTCQSRAGLLFRRTFIDVMFAESHHDNNETVINVIRTIES